MSFIENGDVNSPGDPPADSFNSPPNDEPIKMSLTGSREAIRRMVHLLHRANIIGGSEWSRPITTQKGEWVIVATRRISID